MSFLRILRRPEYILTLCVLIFAAGGMSFAINYFKLYLNKLPIYPQDGRQVRAIPAESASWVRVGADQRMPPEVEEVLGTLNYVSRTYTRRQTPAGQEPLFINFHAAYYTGMIDTVPHVPDRCMVGAGLLLDKVIGDIPIPLDTSNWTPNEDVPDHLRGRIYRARTGEQHTDLPNQRINLPRDAQGLKLRVMRFTGESRRPIYAGYFFIANGGWVAGANDVRLLAFDLKATYAYYMKIEFQSQSVNSAEELAAVAGEFLTEYFAEIMRCVPDWVEVEAGRYPPESTRAAGQT
ncbi:MAG: hypothetical protein KF859_08660 [Phycisphaeraceae bacterium]|nr:hypothetical protein [Phycisphaeraceae bacterium]